MQECYRFTISFLTRIYTNYIGKSVCKLLDKVISI